MTNCLKFNDTVQFSLLNKNLVKINDDYQQGSFSQQPGSANGLKVTLAATHAGIVIRNNRLYLPDRMRKGVKTFVQDYPAPVLLHHDDEKDAIGRVTDAKYVDTSGGIIKDRWKGNEQLIQDFLTDKMPFGQKVDVVRKVLRDSLDDPTYQGLGFAQITANITDQDAIQKLLDGRYMTGSVGASTNQAVCSVCMVDWAEEGPCEHNLGEVYDKAKCFLIAGDLTYNEYSFVNVPADRHSKVLQLDYNGKTVDIEVNDKHKDKIYEVSLGFPQYDKEEDNMADKATEIKDSVENQEVEDSTVEDNTVDENVEGREQPTEEQVEDNIEETSEETKPKDFISLVLDSEASLSDEDEEAFYDEIWKEVQNAFEAKEFTLDQVGVEKLEDARLSAKKRKSLPKSSFCGPERSFPVPDCAHVTAARRLIGRYKGPGSKSAILACVSRKAKAMGCDTKKKDSVQVTEDNLSHSRMLRMVLGVLDEDTYYTDKPVLDDEEKNMLQIIIKRMAGMVGKDSFQTAVYAEELAYDETALLDEVTRLEENLGDLRDRLEASQKEYHLLFKDMEELQDSVVESKASIRKSKEEYLETLSNLNDKEVKDRDFTQLDDSVLDSELIKLSEGIDIKKIVDRLDDGMSRNPEGEVDDPSGIQDNTNEGKDKKKISMKDLEKIQEQHLYLRLGYGQQAADQYLIDLKTRGILPEDLDVNDIQEVKN